MHQAWQADRLRPGAKITGMRLRPIVDSTTVRVRTARPWSRTACSPSTKDFVGGVVVVECANLDEAIEIAAGHPYARWGGIENRPLWE